MTVLEEQGSRYILTNGDLEIPLNTSEVMEPLAIGDLVKVFLFADRRGDLQATTVLPAIHEGEYGWARVFKVTREGAFWILVHHVKY